MNQRPTNDEGGRDAHAAGQTHMGHCALATGGRAVFMPGCLSVYLGSLNVSVLIVALRTASDGMSVLPRRNKTTPASKNA